MHDPFPCDLLLSGGTVLPINEEMDVIEDGAVAVGGDTILAVGPRASVEAEYSASRTMDASDALVMPGLVNGHAHTPMTILRGYKDDLPLEAWLAQIQPWEQKNVNPDSVRANSLLAIAEMMSAGITTVNDMYFYGTVTACVAMDSGIRALVSEPYAEGGPYGFDDMVDALAGLMEEFGEGGLITPTVGPHSVYGCTKEQLLECARLAERYGSPLVIHLAESKGETASVMEQQGMRPVAYAHALGLLTERTIAAHCVDVRPDEIELLAGLGVAVIHLPHSNMKLASGIAPIPALLDAGIKVGLGTDGAASNNVLDILEEVKTAALLDKISTGDAAALGAAEACRMVTVEGARALGLADATGSLEVGKKADIITVRLDSPHMTPCYNPYSHLVYAANGSDVDTVVIDGKVVMEDRELKTIDVEKAISDVRSLAASHD